MRLVYVTVFAIIILTKAQSWDLYESSNLTAVHIAILVEALDVLKLLLDQPDILVSLETKTKSANHVKNGLVRTVWPYHLSLLIINKCRHPKTWRFQRE